MRTKILFLLLFCFLIPVTAFAHPGRTDSNGGHTDRSTGEYHFHHGYEAHQHTDGICPYDFDDKTGENSGSSSGGGNSDNAGSSDLSSDCSEASEELTLIESFSGYDPSYDYDKYMEYLAAIDAGDISSDLSYEYWLDQKEESQFFRFFRDNAFVIICVLFLLWPIWFIPVFFAYDFLAHRKERKENEARFQQEQAKYQELYGGKTREEIAAMCGMPARYVIGQDDLPKERYVQGWGESLTFYISPSGHAYHRSPTCTMRANIPCHAFRLYGRRPCKKCNPAVPDTSWYTEYLRIMRIVEKYELSIDISFIYETSITIEEERKPKEEGDALITVPQSRVLPHLKEQERDPEPKNNTDSYPSQ